MKRIEVTSVLIVCLIAFLSITSIKVLVANSIQNTVSTGIGVIGDSASEGYHCIGRGGEDSFAWTELAQDWRGVNFGPMCSGYNVAHSGDTTADIANQAAALIDPIQNGEVDLVIMYMGANNLRPVCDNNYTAGQIKALQNSMLAQLENGVTDLMAAGLPPTNLYMVNQADRSEHQVCSNAAQLSDLVDALNVDIAAMAAKNGFQIIDINILSIELAKYKNADGDYEIAGFLVKNSNCDLPTCLLVADGHPNTVANGILFNSLFADVLGAARLSDEEIAMAAGLMPLVPTETPSATPTATATCTAVSSITPSLTVPAKAATTPTATLQTATSTPIATPTRTATSTATSESVPLATAPSEPTATQTAVPTGTSDCSNAYLIFMPILSK